MVNLIIIFTITITILIALLVIFMARNDKENEAEIAIHNTEIGCCGTHDNCEKENLHILSTKIEYFDDDELDNLSGIDSEKFTDNQIASIEDVFYTLKEEDVIGWLKSIQLRDINLPDHIKEQALMIASERMH